MFALLLLIAILIILTKETLLWGYILQLKEYRRYKLREYFKSPQGRASIVSKKYIIRIILFTVLILVGGLIEANANSHNDIFFALASLSIIADGCQSGRSLMRGIRKPDRTKRMILIIIITTLINMVIIGIIIGAIVMMHNQFDTDEFFTTIYDIFRGYILPFYALQAIPRLPLLIAHLLILPISIYQKKKILGQAKSYITRQGRITIGISGSYGKSSVKMFLSALLQSQYPVISTPGNVNTEIGISQFILKEGEMERKKEREISSVTNSSDYLSVPQSLSPSIPTQTYFICEMGTYAIGETKIIGDIINHHYGFLTGLNNQHIDLFGSLTNAITAESEILINLRQVSGTIYANRDDALVRSVSFAGVRLVRYSITNPNADAFSDNINGQPGSYTFTFHYKEKKCDFQTNVIGRHNILNLTGVIACAIDQGIEKESLTETVKTMGQYQKTLHITSHNQFTLIDDSYNINQDGVKAGLDLLSEYKTKRIVVIDEIIELGEESEQTHRQIGQTLSPYDLDLIILTGKNYGDWIAQSYTGHSLLIQSYKTGQDYCLDKIGKFHEATTIVFLGRGTQNLLQLLRK